MTFMPSPSSVRLFVTSLGNEFMVDIASLLADGFQAAGVQAEVLLDGRPSLSGDAVLQIIVAPHEYFPLFLVPAVSAGEAARLAATSYVLNVEQPGGQWFEVAHRYAAMSRGVFDISAEGALELRRRGLRAQHVPLGYGRTLEGPQIAHAERPIDVLFLGHNSPRRDQLLAEIADMLSDRDFRMVLSDVSAPRLASTPGYEAGTSRARLFASAKIVLNIHSADRRYFETHRALYAFANRCLLITETSRGTAPLVNGRHFVMGPPPALGQLCRQYLGDIPALRDIAEAGYELARHELSAVGAARRILAAAVHDFTAGAVDQNEAPVDGQSRRIFVDRLSRSRSFRGAGGEDWTIESNPADARPHDSAVSVVVTLHNYSQYVATCLGSVMRSQPVPGGFEIVVVDDASTDASVDCVRRLMAEAVTPIRLVRKHSNTGPADSRNIGIRLSRASRIFILDADNWIYPQCLPMLIAALGGSVAAVYGVIRRFDDETGESLGLLSALAWDVPRLVAGPYIDAMAMFERDALQAVGCYSTELIEHGWFGWEDYDLWLKLAGAGRECRHVPRVLSAYRVHPSAMLRRTESTSANTAAYFHQKFKPLVELHLGLDAYFGFPAARPGPDIEPPDDPQVAGLKQRCHDLENELAAVYASKSWRVAAPLRALYRLISGRS